MRYIVDSNSFITPHRGYSPKELMVEDFVIGFGA